MQRSSPTPITLALEAWWEAQRQRKEQAVRIACWVLTNQKSDQRLKTLYALATSPFLPYRCAATFVINEQNGNIIQTTIEEN